MSDRPPIASANPSTISTRFSRIRVVLTAMTTVMGVWLTGVTGIFATGAEQAFVPGQVVASVTTLADSSQNYALFLPSQYRADRAWPLLLAFHPGARGVAFTELYKDVANDYGYIVAASNTSRNGPWAPSLAAAQAMLQDVGQRFSVDPARLYATGFSGGARVATQIALQSGGFVGVIASGAGFPDAATRRTVRFDVAATVGRDDFNYGELRALDRALASPHRVFYFDGPHTLPPATVARQAVEWLELRAMIRGLRPKDPVVIERWWTQRLSEAEVGEPAAVAVALEALAQDFAPVRDVAEVTAKVRSLKAQDDVKRALAQQKKLDDEEARVLVDVATFEAGLRVPDSHDDALFRARSLLLGLHRKAQAADDTPERRMARRVLRVVTGGARERTTDPEYLKVIDQVRPVRSPAGGGYLPRAGADLVTMR